MRFFRRVTRKFSHAFHGLSIAFTTDNSFKAHLMFSILAVIPGFFVRMKGEDWALITIAIGLVFVSELFNTAIEYLVHMFTTEYNALAEKLLDISAGAVLFAAFTSLGIGIFVYGPKLLVLVGIR